MTQGSSCWLGKQRNARVLGRVYPGEGMQKTTYISPVRLPLLQLEHPSQLGFFPYRGCAHPSTGWKLVGNFLTKWILLGKCWLTENKAFHSVCQLQWNSDWESVLCSRMKFLLKTTDRGPPLNSQKLSSWSSLLRWGRSGVQTLAPAQILLTEHRDSQVQ